MAEKKTGFVKGGGTPSRNCHICRFMKGEVCTQAEMIKHSRQPKNWMGLPFVDKDDICNYFFQKKSVGELLKKGE